MAQLPYFQTSDKDLQLMQTRWSSIINPVLALPLNSAPSFIKNVSLSVGNNTINHLLQRPYQGYIVTGMHNAYAQIYDVTSQSPALTLILHASAATSVDLVIF